jgi:hypothetical protein
MVFGVLVVMIGGVQIFTKSLPRVAKKCGPSILSEILAPIGLEAAVLLEWFFLMPTTAGTVRVSLHLFLIAATVLYATCITLNRLTAEPLRLITSLPLVLPGLLVPLVAPGLCLPYALYCLVYVLLFVHSVVLQFSKALTVPIFGNPPLKKAC